MVISGMYGLGDNVYQRSVIREIKERVYLYTTWPQLYSDLPNIKPVKPNTNLRTQLKNVSMIPQSIWNVAPKLPQIKISYTSNDLKNGSILRSMSKKTGTNPKIFDIPKFRDFGIQKPYAVIRPVTVRSEWYNISRSPENEYILSSAELLKKAGYTVVSVADICKEEWCLGLPNADINFNNGELNFEQLMGVIQHADVVVGGVGWIVPVCSASLVNLVCILGGLGAHNDPKKIIDHPMDSSKIKFIYPDNFCMCSDNRHACNKKISNFNDKFIEVIKDLN